MVTKCLFFVCLGISMAVLAADPTRPPDWMTTTVQESQPLPVLTLQQVRVSPTDAVAVINNQLVRVGDKIDGAQVLAIKAGVVTVKIRQKRQELSLLNNTRQDSE